MASFQFSREITSKWRKNTFTKAGVNIQKHRAKAVWGLQKALHHLRVQVQKDRGNNNVQHLCQVTWARLHKWPLHLQSNPEIGTGLFPTLQRQAEDVKLGNWPALTAGAYWRDYQARAMSVSTLHHLAGIEGSSPSETRDDTMSPTTELSKKKMLVQSHGSINHAVRSGGLLNSLFRTSLLTWRNARQMRYTLTLLKCTLKWARERIQRLRKPRVQFPARMSGRSQLSNSSTRGYNILWPLKVPALPCAYPHTDTHIQIKKIVNLSRKKIKEKLVSEQSVCPRR